MGRQRRPAPQSLASASHQLAIKSSSTIYDISYICLRPLSSPSCKPAFLFILFTFLGLSQRPHLQKMTCPKYNLVVSGFIRVITSLKVLFQSQTKVSKRENKRKIYFLAML